MLALVVFGAALGSLESLLAGLPENIKSRMLAYTREWVRSLRFGAPTDGVVRAENFGGALVPFTTSATVDGEVAVPHGLSRVPRLLIPMLRLDVVNATLPVLTVTRVPDMTYVYVSSSTVNATTLGYVE